MNRSALARDIDFGKFPQPNFACSASFPPLGCEPLKLPVTAPVSQASPRPRFFGAWLLAPLGAIAFLLGIDAARVRRVEHVSGLAPWSTKAPAIDERSPTGYAHGQRRFIAPEHDNGTYQWIAQVQQAKATGAWRLRHVDSDNAPLGRETRAAAPYREWIGLLAGVDRAISGRAAGLSVERAALFAGPALHVLFVVAATFFAARRFGRSAAVVISIGLVTLFPFAGEFIPGILDERALALGCFLGSLLPLVSAVMTLRGEHVDAAESAGPAAAATADLRMRPARRDFALAGVAGGIGLWIDAPFQFPLLFGIGLSGVAVAFLGRRSPDVGREIPWRLWSLVGGLTSLIAYAFEYFPGAMTLQLETNHPLFALAWMGGGELLAQTTIAVERKKLTWRPAECLVRLAALAALLAWPMTKAWQADADFFGGSLIGSRLTLLNGGMAAPNFTAWIGREGASLAVFATLVPMLLIPVAAMVLSRRRVALEHRCAVMLTLGPIAIALALAFGQLRWWAGVEAAILVLAMTLSSVGKTRRASSGWQDYAAVLPLLVLVPGISLLPLRLPPGGADTLTEVEVQGMIERDVAYWLNERVGGTAGVVLTTPQVSAALAFHGSLRGIGTFDGENQAGFSAATRMASATTADEAFELLRNRAVTYLVIPSWDPFLDEYARIGLRASPGSSLYEKSFIASLHRWALPRWLHPVPYPLPSIAGFEGQAVVVLERVEEQDEVVALSRLAEYFVEMDQLEAAQGLRESLQRFRGSLVAWLALAQISAARGDAEMQVESLKRLIGFITAGADRVLPWDRRVSLAILLAQAKQIDLAREQARRGFAEIDASKMQWLTTNSLFRFQALGKIFSLEIPDPQLRSLALSRLPPGLRQRLEASSPGRRE